ncbi:MAG: hypothetical protein HYR73_09215 [Candidatus Eisenbacteria bacterium]|nr:hypothetical protein [Candidatus Eisenbacteria bacterium]
MPRRIGRAGSGRALRVLGRVLLVVLGVTVEIARAEAASMLVLPRPGQLGLTVQGQYGSLLDSGNLGSEFGSGGGLAVRLRYRMRYERAIGLSFENQTLDARSAPTSATDSTQMSMLLSGADFYQLFNTSGRTQEMLSVGAGIAQIHYTLRDGETEYPLEGDGVYVSAGVGIERFFYRSFAFDLSGRYYAVFEGGKTNHDLQAAAGIIFYASY